MHHSSVCAVLAYVGVIALVSACSGPTKPSDSNTSASKATTTPTQPPTNAPPKGNVLFASATPVSGTQITVSTSTPSQAPSLIVSFSALFDTDLPDVLMQIQLLDTSGRVCASGVSPKSNLAANATVTFTVNGFSLACSLPVTTASMQASLMPASGGSAYGQTSVPAQYAFKLATTPPSPPTSTPDGISLASVIPSSGSEFVITDNSAVGGIGLSIPNFQAAFAVVYKDALPDAKLEVELLDPAGAQCWDSFYDHAVPAGSAETISVTGAGGFLGPVFQNGTCATFPERIASVRATLLTLRGPEVNGRLARTNYLSQTFPLVYTIDRYPPAPPNAPPTPPTITAVTYALNVPVGLSDPPLPGDDFSAGCRVAEADGAAMTITITVAFDGITPQRWTGTQPVGASSSPEGAFFVTDVPVPTTLKAPIHLRITCDATNSRGQTASRSIDIGTPK